MRGTTQREPNELFDSEGFEGEKEKDFRDRLIEWQVQSLLGLLKKIEAFRRLQKKRKREPFSLRFDQGETVLEEVKEIIELPVFQAMSTLSASDLDAIDLGKDVELQLHSFVSKIAGMYLSNPFHNFEHAVRNRGVETLSEYQSSNPCCCRAM